MPSPQTHAPTPSPEQEAIEYYNDGVFSRDKADKYEAESATETEAAKKTNLLEKSKSAHESSIKKYTKAVALEANYTPAIEYRAEAYLGLDKLDEVKSAYMTLFSADRKRADELASAMQKYVERKQADPAGVDPAAIQDFGKWVAERKQLASQTSSLADPNAPSRW